MCNGCTSDTKITVETGKEKLEIKLSKEHIKQVEEHTDISGPQVLIEAENQVLRAIGTIDKE